MSCFIEEAKYFKENGEVDLLKEALFGNEDPNARIVGNVVYTVMSGKAMVVNVEVIHGGNVPKVLIRHLSEDLGPNDIECPESVLKLLKPTDSPIANMWREECWETARRVNRLNESMLNK